MRFLNFVALSPRGSSDNSDFFEEIRKFRFGFHNGHMRIFKNLYFRGVKYGQT